MKEYEPFEYVERDEDSGFIDESFLVLYAGEGLNKKFPNDYYLWLWLPNYKMWERHAVDKMVELRKLSENQKLEIVRAIFLSEKWVIAS